MIRTLLIANRGEIAVRIIRTCRNLGIRTVAIFSDADAHALHLQLADTAVHIGPAPTSQSYLNIPAIISAAHRTHADAIHPGFGFLAENAAFAQACADANLIFIGPTPAAIAAMGNKRAAKECVAQANVPIIPGYSGADQNDHLLVEEARRIGFPLMVKAAAGGGGKGMRLVHKQQTLPEAIVAARREALQAFGSDELILERALLRPRHVEIQVIGDTHGQMLYLGERECSIQRRHQKVIEEAPSPALTPELRQQMGETAVRAARAVAYHNAGTVEFLLDEDGRFYFLEMNTRLQVEHPVTELITGIDLVAWQILIAEGAPLPLAQEQVTLQGHAIEARVYAENPANDFLPVTGPVLLWQPPTGAGIRVDSGIQTGDELSIHYDPMLAKLIAHGPDRQTAVRRLLHALESCQLLGFPHNIPFLADLLRHPEFIQGNLSTHFIEEHFAQWQPPMPDATAALITASLAQFAAQPQRPENAGYWRNNPNRPQWFIYQLEQQQVKVCLQPQPRTRNQFVAYFDQAPQTHFAVTLIAQHGPNWVVQIDGVRQSVTAVHNANTWWIQTNAGTTTLEAIPLLPEPHPPADAAGSLRAPMPGSVLAVLVQVGQHVQEGQALMKLEAMKMEHTIRTASDGLVEAIYYAPGDTVEADAQLLKIAPTQEPTVSDIE
jgi:acetyl-CoA carboxylase biotin carboxylase subunit